MGMTQEKLLALLDQKTGGPASGMKLDVGDPVFRYKLRAGMAKRPEARQDNLYVTCLLERNWTGVTFDATKLGRAVYDTLGAVE